MFAVFFYIALSKMTSYLHQIEAGIEKITFGRVYGARTFDRQMKPIEKRVRMNLRKH